jgi:hypothetical protein
MKTQIHARGEVCPVTIFCTFLECRKPFTPTNRRQRFCSASCRSAARYLPLKAATQLRKNARFQARNRDRALGFDGKYGGPDCPSYGGTPIGLHPPR